MTLRIAVNPLETRRFGVTCARAESAAAADMPAIDRWCRDQRVDMLTIRMAVDEASGKPARRRARRQARSDEAGSPPFHRPCPGWLVAPQFRLQGL